MSDRLFERVWTQVDTRGRCWYWRGPINSSGYGRIVTKKPKKEYVHRLVYQWAWGPLEEGQVVMHTCDTPLCVKPSHLRAGTQLDNMADMHRKGRREYRRKTHCRNGHAFTPENTTICRQDGSQRCRECTNAPRRKANKRVP